jgi:uncharacterized protein YidB (DUF937 family)
LQQVLGSDTVKQLAARFDIPVDQLTKVLAQQLPSYGPDGKLLSPAKLAAVDGAGPFRPEPPKLRLSH